MFFRVAQGGSYLQCIQGDAVVVGACTVVLFAMALPRTSRTPILAWCRAREVFSRTSFCS